MAHIYKITKIGSDECYVGHTSLKPSVRWVQHLYLLKLGTHHARKLQAVFNTAGADGLSFEVIENCADEDKVDREQYYMDTLNSCFNIGPAWNSKFGYKLTEEQLARQWFMDPEKSKAAALKRVGLTRTEEQRLAMAAAQQANERAGQHRLGIKETEEQTVARLALSKAGMEAAPHIWITDGKDNKRHPLSEPVAVGWHQGRTFSEEHKAAVLSAAGPRSDEARANIKAGHANTWSDPVKRAAMMANRRPFKWNTNGTDSKRVADDETPPAGWWNGKGTQPKQPKAPQGPQTWITDGTDSRKVDAGSELPSGWRSGRTFTQEHKAAIAASGTTFDNPEVRAKAQAALDIVTAAKVPQVWITDGVTNRKVDAATPNVPDGWAFGHTLSSEGRASISSAASAMMRKAVDPDEPTLL